VLHCFTVTARLAEWAIDAGFYVSFAGIVTFANARELRDVVKTVPLDRLLVETDCPYLAPIPFRGKRNEPAYVVEVARTVAQLKGVEMADLDAVVTQSFEGLFGLRRDELR
jgi:TatD DNase family protein